MILGRRDDADIKPFFETACSKRPAEELYDLRRDPHQINNVAGKSDYADTRKRLRAELDHWMAKTGDPRAKGETDFWDRTPYYGGPARTPGAPK